ncbi:host-nuclease inhibitor Gam family protein [bacterium]|nr:host-nuclease inhibitor Gam family protein [bacterium]
MKSPQKDANIITTVAQAMRRQFTIRTVLRDMWWAEQLASARIQRANQQKEDRLGFLRERLRGLIDPLVAFVRKERDSLADPKNPKMIRLAGGTIERTAAHRITVTDEDAALAALKRMKKKHPDAIRTKLEINKLYLHAHPELVDAIPGIEWDDTPALTFSFLDNDARIEYTDDDVLTITLPRRQK